MVGPTDWGGLGSLSGTVTVLLLVSPEMGAGSGRLCSNEARLSRRGVAREASRAWLRGWRPTMLVIAISTCTICSDNQLVELPEIARQPVPGDWHDRSGMRKSSNT